MPQTYPRVEVSAEKGHTACSACQLPTAIVRICDMGPQKILSDLNGLRQKHHGNPCAISQFAYDANAPDPGFSFSTVSFSSS